ncbi:hypothetical protein [Mycoplasma todarodis]|uniref:hypothetical protein n=1 Tax=Mycoplasma todarodis TaxID=1937191 RepID=UPI003B2F8C9C
MKTIASKTFEKFYKTQKLIINLFLLASLIITSIIIGTVPQIPLWVLMVTIPMCLVSIILFYIKSYSYMHNRWIFCHKHEEGFEFSKKKNLKYLYFGIFMLIPLFNWIPILSIKKYEEKKTTKEMISCNKEHLKTRSLQTDEESAIEKRAKQFNEEF